MMVIRVHSTRMTKLFGESEWGASGGGGGVDGRRERERESCTKPVRSRTRRHAAGAGGNEFERESGGAVGARAWRRP